MPSKKSRYDSIVTPKHSVLRAAGRLLSFELKEVEAKHAGTVEGTDPEELHDFRTNLRRLRALLRIFRKDLRDVSGTRVEGLARDFTKRLGTARDLDVWIDYLQSHASTGTLARAGTWQPFLRAQKQRRSRAYTRLRAHLNSPAYGVLAAALHDLLKQLKSKNESGKPGSITQFAGAKLSKIYIRIAIQTRLPPKSNARELHEVRKLCRKGRYYAEFFSPVLGRPAKKLAVRMKKLTDALGAIHDCDVFPGHIKKAGVQPPKELKRIVLRDRDAGYENLLTAWERVTGPKFRKKLLFKLGAR